MRAVSGLEVASVIATVLITTWALIPLQPRQRWLTALPTLLAMGLMIHSQRVRGETAREIGLSSRYFLKGLGMVAAPTLAACAILLVIGYSANSFHRTTHFWGNLIVVPVWALIQQYVLLGFLYRRLREIRKKPADASSSQLKTILITAAIFAGVHAPNLTLMVLTFVGAAIWAWVYERAPNLYAIALSHAAISLMLMTSLPPWMLQSMSVGYKHFLYQKF
jgi:membrane protease YdiL (CAAX protease family)